MTTIKSLALEEKFNSLHLQASGFLGSAIKLTIQQEFRNSDWETCKSKIDSYKSIAEGNNSEENIFKLYLAIKGIIENVNCDRTYQARKILSNNGITNLRFNFAFFSIKADHVMHEDKEAYINQQIDSFISIVNQKLNPSLLNKINSFFETCNFKFL